MEPPTRISERADRLRGYSKFRRLSIVHAGMMGGDAVMVVALADTLFFSIDPTEGRDKVLLFLLVSFAPFLLIAPLIGPALDRIAGGRRAVIQFVAIARIALSVAMALVVDNVALFPLVFAALVLQKTYAISKSAIVPSVVHDQRDLVEANAKLGLISGGIGAVAVTPALLIQATPLGGSGTLVYAALVFAATLYAALFLSADRVAETGPSDVELQELASGSIQAGAIVMMVLRGSVGFMFFLVAFYLKDIEAAAITYGFAVGGGTLGTVLGNAISPRVRHRLSETRMLGASLMLAAGAGMVAALIGGTAAMVLLAFCVNLAASIGRMGFEALVQHNAPHASFGQTFARFETRFQFTWVLGGLLPVLIVFDERVGALIVAGLAIVGIVYVIAWPKLVANDSPVVARSHAAVARSQAVVAKLRTRKRSSVSR